MENGIKKRIGFRYVAFIALLLVASTSNADIRDHLRNCDGNCYAQALKFAQLSQAVYGSTEKGEHVATSEGTFVSIDVVEDSSGFFATIYEKRGGDKEIVIAYRGTDGLSPRDWEDNIKQLISSDSTQYSQSINLARGVKSAFPSRTITLTGHSLGGGLATAAALDEFLPAHVFSPAAVKQVQVNQSREDLKSYVISSADRVLSLDVVPSIGFDLPYGPIYEIKTNEKRIETWYPKGMLALAGKYTPVRFASTGFDILEQVNTYFTEATFLVLLHSMEFYLNHITINADPNALANFIRSQNETFKEYSERVGVNCQSQSSLLCRSSVEIVKKSSAPNTNFLVNTSTLDNKQPIFCDLQPRFRIYDNLTGNRLDDNGGNREIRRGQVLRLELSLTQKGADAKDCRRSERYERVESEFLSKNNDESYETVFTDSSERYEFTSMDNLDVNDTHTHSRLFTVIAPAGTIKKFKACGDVNDDLREGSNEADNCRTESFTVVQAPPTGEVKDITCEGITGTSSDLDKLDNEVDLHVYAWVGTLDSREYVGASRTNSSGDYFWRLPEILKDGAIRHFEVWAINYPEGDNIRLPMAPDLSQDTVVCAIPFGDAFPVYRLYDPANGHRHFYALGEGEKDSRLLNPLWSDEGVAWYAYRGPSVSGTSPVHRFYRKTDVHGSHFYTINQAEVDATQRNPDWIYEGVSFHAYSSASIKEGLSPVYRFRRIRNDANGADTGRGSHFFTASSEEKEFIEENDSNWIYEGVGFYTLPSSYSEVAALESSIQAGETIPTTTPTVPPLIAVNPSSPANPIDNTDVSPTILHDDIVSAVDTTTPIPANQAPQITEVRPSDAYSLTTGETRVIGIRVDDEDVNTLVFSATSSNASIATISPQGTGAFLLSAIAPGVATLTLTVTEPEGLSDSATVSVDVTTRNGVPVARDDVYVLSSTTSPTEFMVTTNDFDPDGDALEVVLATPTSNLGGQLAVSGASVRYTPPANLSQDDLFQYTVRDPSGSISETATVTISLSDVDGDGIADAGDNCPVYPNTNQSDMDSDGLGNECDIDPDGDGQIGQSGQEFASGETLFKDKCLVCHLANTISTPVVGDRNVWDTHIASAGGIEVVIGSVLSGKGAMPVFGATHTAKEITQATLFLSGRETPEVDVDNPGQEDPAHPLTDLDLDGVADATDNCPRFPNSDQLDTDANSVGNACEPDADNDGDGIPAAEDTNDADATILPGNTGAGEDTSVVSSDDDLALGELAESSSENTGQSTGAELDDDEFIDAAEETFPDVTPTLDSETVSASGIFNVDAQLTDSTQAEFLIRLTTAIPLNPLLRVYEPQTGLWSDFAASDNDMIQSAQSLDGVCPAIMSANYRNGLNAGWNCVKLFVVDGGLNDADNQINGVVSLIARVASERLLDDVSTVQSSTSTSSSGGGRIGFLMVLAIFGSIVLRTSQMRKRRNGECNNGI